MITICRKAFFYEQLKIEKSSFFEVPSMPLIIFEYHQETKKVFNIKEIQRELGDGYLIYRLRQDATLDNDVLNAWNCVAIPRNSQFFSILKSRISV